MGVETCTVTFSSSEKFINFDIKEMVRTVFVSLNRLSVINLALGPAAAERLARQQGFAYPETVDGGTIFGMAVSIDPSLGPWDIRATAEPPP